MSEPGIPPDLHAWIGREDIETASLDLQPVRALAATLDLDQAPNEGDPLPPGWHWLFLNPLVRRSALDVDGHPRRGGFLPPVDLPRRMWAGGRTAYTAPLTVGQTATRRSRIIDIRDKSGRSGRLCFVTLEHIWSADDRACIVEQQNIVYREASTRSASAASSPEAGEPGLTSVPRWCEDFVADSTLLFRYSALTFNAHRIHYDRDYAREVEGYPELVVHGPLTATLLQGFATRIEPSRPLSAFEFRGVAPLFADQPFRLEADTGSDGSLMLRAVDQDGRTAMEAQVRFGDAVGTVMGTLP